MPSPTDVAGLLHWYEADAGTSTTTDGATVSQWDDQTSADHATQATAADRPTYEAGELNGLPVLRFNPLGGGGPDYLDASGVGPISQPNTIFIVAKKATSASGNAVDGISARQAIYASSENLRVYAGTAEITIGSNLWGDHGFHVISVVFDGASTTVRFDGVGQTVSGSPGTSGLTGLRIGTFTADAAGWPGDEALVLIYSGAKSTGDQQLVEQYIFDKYGVGIDHGLGESHETVTWQSSYVVRTPTSVSWQSSYVVNAHITTLWASSYSVEGPVPQRTIRVREKPSLRQIIDLETTIGRHYRWALDETDPSNVFSGLRYSDTMPGGHERGDCVLPRKQSVDYADLERLSTLRVMGPGGEIASELRLENAPETSGDQMAISPGLVGWVAALDDNKFARALYRDIDLSHWQGAPSSRRIDLAGAGDSYHEPQTVQDSAVPSINTGWSGGWDTVKPSSEAHYDAGSGLVVESVYYAWERLNPANMDPANVNWDWQLFADDNDDFSSTIDSTGNLRAGGPGAGTFTPSTAARYVLARLKYDATTGGADQVNYGIVWSRLAVRGDHGLPLRGTEPNAGFYGSDIVAHAVGAWAPLLNVYPDSIQQSSFIIPHLVFLEPTTAGEMVRQASRFELPDWAVWDDREFVWHEPGARGRTWRLRSGATQLEATGQSVERLWESIVVQYQDVDGSARTVGPPGSGADTESSSLKDDDPDNPANKRGIVRRDRLVMGVTTPAGAIKVGRRFLEQTKLLDTSGRAKVVGWAEDDRGVLHPYWAMRSGDRAVFVDARDTSPRKIVRTEKDHPSRSCTIDLDAPPEGLAQLLERLGVVLVPFGVG